MTSEGKGKGSTFYIELPCYEATGSTNEDMFAGLLDPSRIFIAHDTRMGKRVGSTNFSQSSVNGSLNHSGSRSKSKSKSSHGSRSSVQSFQRMGSKLSRGSKTGSRTGQQLLSRDTSGQELLFHRMTSNPELETFEETSVQLTAPRQAPDIENGAQKEPNTTSEAVGDSNTLTPDESSPQLMTQFVRKFRTIARVIAAPLALYAQIAPSQLEDKDELDSEYNNRDIAVADSSGIKEASLLIAQTKEMAFHECSVIPSVSMSRNNSDLGSVVRSASGLSISKSIKLRNGMSFSSLPQQSYRILIVDDSVPTRKIMNRLLSREQHIVTEAADGIEAVEMVYDRMQSKSDDKPMFDLILMDYYMAQMTGPEAIKAIRHLGYTGVILGVSGVMDEDANQFIEAGANLVLCKPLTLTALWKALRSTSFFDEG